MSNSNFLPIIVGSALMLATVSAAANAQEVPNLVGTWSGTIVGGALFGALNHSEPENEPVFADRTKVWTLVIEKQDGTGLIGTWSTPTKTEKLTGVIRADNVSVLLADQDNTFDARLTNQDEMELCALHAGASTIAVCLRMRRD